MIDFIRFSVLAFGTSTSLSTSVRSRSEVQKLLE
ncbi:MAG: hypothetical protein ACI8X3_002696 [Saprospiraceae bacterium]